MKYLVLTLLLIGLSVSSEGQNSWQLKKEKNGIKVYTRDFPDSDFKEYKAVMLVNANIDTIKSIILDADNLKDWNYKTSQSRLIKKIDESNYIFYIYNDMPWPISNRDHISDIKVIPLDKNVFRITITPNNKVLPETKGVIRITNFKGYWLLEQTEMGCRITHQLFGDPGGGVPSWLVNSKLIQTPYISFMNLKKLLDGDTN